MSILSMKNDISKAVNNLTAMKFTNFCRSYIETISFAKVLSTSIQKDGAVLIKLYIDLGAFMSYPITFMAIRGKEIFTADDVQNFRTNLDKHTLKGIVLTTGKFSREAKKMAHKIGMVPIDFIDEGNLTERFNQHNWKISQDTGHILCDKK